MARLHLIKKVLFIRLERSKCGVIYDHGIRWQEKPCLGLVEGLQKRATNARTSYAIFDEQHVKGIGYT